MADKIPCFAKVNMPDLAKLFDSKYKEGMSEAEQRKIGTDIALEYHKQLDADLRKFKTDIGIKAKDIKPYEAPKVDEEKIKKINDEYQAKIDEANTPIPEQKPTEKTGGKEELVTETPPPTGEPPKDKPVGDGEGAAGITHAATEETTRKAGLPDYEGHEPVSHPERIAAAKKAIADNPNLADEIMTKVEKGGNLTPQDNAVLAVYKGALDSELEANPSKEVYDRVSRIAKVLNPEGTYAGQLLESRKLVDFNEDNLSNFLMGKEAAQGTALSEAQIKTESAKYTELKEAKEKLETELAAEKEKYQKLAAEIGVNKAKAAARKASKKTKEEHIQDRKAIVEAARAALKKIRGDGSLKSTIPGIAELKALAPHIKSYMQDLLNEGVDKFDNIISAIHAEFKDVLDNLRKTDIIDILAGSHDEEIKGQTRNEKANSLRLIKREAALLKELADARKGVEKTKIEKNKTAGNRRIDELTKKIKEVKQLRKKELEVEPVEDVSVGSAEALDKEIDRLTKKADKLLNDIKNKKYLEEKPKPTVFKKSRKAQILEDRVIDLENKIRHERSVDEYSKRSKARRIFDKVMEVLGVRRLVQSAVDISVPFRQGATMISPRRIDVWAKGFKANLQSVFNPKKFERIMRGIRQDPMYHDMVKDGVVFNDLSSADPNLHNEDFRKSFVYKIPILSEPLKASNRSADAFLNIARYELYKKFRAKLEKQGLTRESDPKAFNYAGNWAMSMTGRGNMHSSLEKPAMNAILGNTFYGARLMASRFNLLNPVTYFDPRVPRQAKVEAMKDMASFTVTVMTIAIGLVAAGGAVSLDPDDPDFLKIRFGDKVYDITGGLSTYVRTFLRIAKAGYTKATGTKEEGDKATAKAGQSTLQFFRNKLSPNTSYGVDAFFGKPYGKDFDPTEIYQIYPMYTDDVLKSLKDDGIMAIPTVLLPNILGLGYANYPSRDDKKQSQGNTITITDPKTFINRDATPEEQKDYESKVAEYVPEIREKYTSGKHMYMDVNGGIHLSRSDNPSAEESTWKRIYYEDLSTSYKNEQKKIVDQKKEFESKVKEKAGDKAKSEIEKPVNNW
tara:strand:+ start:140 stop:3364 length:3225 start_codon:yes stop_codon:yes gene_type:complete